MVPKWLPLTFIVLSVVIIASTIFFAQGPGSTGNNSLDQLGPERAQRASNLPACDEQQFTVSPIDLAAVISITPLGNTAPPDHTLPTEHTYWQIDDGKTVPTVPLVAPGDIQLTTIAKFSSPNSGQEDFSINFSLCQDIHGYFIHVQELSPELKTLFDNAECKFSNTSESYEYCERALSLAVPAGTPLGLVGVDRFGPFDFGAYDYRTELPYLNSHRYYDRSHYIICPLDLYGPTIRDALYAKLDRAGDVSCGEVMQDIFGTLQGNWFHEDIPRGEPGEWYQHLSFLHLNTDPAKAIITIGGVVADPARWIFTPANEGAINRQFSEVEPGAIQCYQADNQTGIILVQLTDETTLTIEQQPGSCSNPREFFTPSIYRR